MSTINLGSTYNSDLTFNLSPIAIHLFCDRVIKHGVELIVKSYDVSTDTFVCQLSKFPEGLPPIHFLGNTIDALNLHLKSVYLPLIDNIYE